MKLRKYFHDIYYKIIPYITLKYFKSNYVVEFFNSKTNYGTITAKRSYALRHKVYCEELGYEEARKTQQEFDDYDKNSIGCLISTKAKKGNINLDDPAISGVRLVFPSQELNGKDLPCLESIKHNYPVEYENIKKQLDGLRYAEISRLLILNNFRNNSMLKWHGSIINNYLLLSVFAASFVLAKDLDCAIFMCEKKMMLFFKKAGIPFTQLMKKGVEHRGTRYPIKLDIAACRKALEEHTNQTLKTLNSLAIFINKKAPRELCNGFAHLSNNSSLNPVITSSA
jgi:N-acyl amino acid synthase of PEP-CTERM/exosortase system